MANYSGSLVGTAPIQSSLDVIGIGFRPGAPVSPTGVLAAFSLAAASYTDEAPIAAVGTTSYSAKRLASESFGWLDWFNKLHFSTIIFNLGPVISTQVRTFTIYSSYLEETRTLNSITPTDAIGLTLTEPGATPLVWQPQDELEYQLTAVTDGPPTIEASYLFDFDTVDVLLPVVGVRVIPWQVEPTWEDPVIERLDWRTDVLRKFDGSEQRIQVREYPRQYWQFSFVASGRERRILESTVYQWAARSWALPVFSDGVNLEQPLNAGATAVPVETANLGYELGGLGIIIAADGTASEAFEVAAINSTSITTDRPLVSSWSPGSRIYPARIAKLTEPLQTTRRSRDVVQGVASFGVETGVAHSAAVETLYRGEAILELPPNLRDGLSFVWDPKTELLESPSGPDYLEDESDLVDTVQALRWTLGSRSEADELRAWLYARAGRARGVWVPTYAEDLVVVATISPTATNIDVEYQGLSVYVDGDVGRRDIRIELLDGTVFYRRTSAYVKVDDSTERLSMDSSLGITVFPEDIRLISWMSYCRLDADSVEISWESGHAAEVLTLLRSFRNDV